MKTVAQAITIFMISIGMSTSVFANLKMNNAHKWVCQTNASSSSNDKDKKADEMMKTAKSGKEAFKFAMEHCRDCTKITCELQTSNSSWMGVTTPSTTTNQNPQK